MRRSGVSIERKKAARVQETAYLTSRRLLLPFPFFLKHDDTGRGEGGSLRAYPKIQDLEDGAD